jgi:hypothetical protein
MTTPNLLEVARLDTWSGMCGESCHVDVYQDSLIAVLPGQVTHWSGGTVIDVISCHIETLVNIRRVSAGLLGYSPSLVDCATPSPTCSPIYCRWPDAMRLRLIDLPHYNRTLYMRCCTRSSCEASNLYCLPRTYPQPWNYPISGRQAWD